MAERRVVAIAAAIAFCAAAAFGLALPGYSQLAHPLALPGAQGMPRALAFNLLVFVMPGVLLAVKRVASRPGVTIGLDALLDL